MIKQRVRQILETNEEARNSDPYLSWLYLRWHEGLNLPFLDYIKLRSLNLDTLSRMRRFWQNDMGLYPPTDPKVAAARKRKSEAMKRVLQRN